MSYLTRLGPILTLLLVPWVVAAETIPTEQESTVVLLQFANAYNAMDVAEMGEMLDEPGLSKFARDVQRWEKLGVKPQLTVQPVQVESIGNELVVQCIVSLRVNETAQLTNAQVLFYLSKRDDRARISKYVVAEVARGNEELEILHDLMVTLRRVANRRDWPATDQLFRHGIAVQDRPKELEGLTRANPDASWLGVLRNPDAKLEDITVQRESSGPVATVAIIDSSGHRLASGRMRLSADEQDGRKRYWLKPIADNHGDGDTRGSP